MIERQRAFILSQGFDAPSEESCSLQYANLQFQPRVVGVATLSAALAGSPVGFVILAGALFWSAAFPQWNVFERFYTRIFGVHFTPAPQPRRFAQLLAGTMSITIAVLMLLGFRTAARVLQVLLLAAVGAILFRGFCFGSYVYHLLRRPGVEPVLQHDERP
jgi:hypothetical protein